MTFLSDYFIKLYPDFETKFYFVPPLYFNKNTYKEDNIGGEHVYITQPPDDNTVKHDVAMARVLHSLRLLADQEEQEVMFVISQFNHGGYLATPRQDFLRHNLHMRASLRKQEKHFEDFDILIVHRHHGVLVGVVKACGDDPGETNDTMIVEALKKGCEQLNKTNFMLNHLMPDKQDETDIHKLLILPNLSQNRLERVLQGDGDMTKDLATCLGMAESSDLHKECLCAEHLSNTESINKLKDLLTRRLMRSNDNTPFSVDQYVTIMSRFCGPGTRWSLTIPGGLQNAVLPTTFKESVEHDGRFFSTRQYYSSTSGMF